MPSLFNWVASHLGGQHNEDVKDEKAAKHLEEFKKIGLTADMLKAGVKALQKFECQDFDRTKEPVIDRVEPPKAALPLLATISQSNYVSDISYLRDLLEPFEFSIREIRRDHAHGWFSRHRDGDEHNPKHMVAPYARVWLLHPKEVQYSDKPAPGWTDCGQWTGGMIIVSFTGSTTGQDWLDDIRAFTHVSTSFLHPDLDTFNSHHGFTDWLNRRLDAPVATLATKSTSGTHTNEVTADTTTVYSAVLRAIGDLREETKNTTAKAKGAGGLLKMFIVGHSLGGAVASLFSLRLNILGNILTPGFDNACLYGDPTLYDKVLDGESIDTSVLPVHLALTVTFGAPRFLWHGMDEDQQKLEAQRAKERAELEARIIAEIEEEKQAGHPIQRGFRPDNTKEKIRLDNLPIVRIVNARDPVPHVPAGAGELPSGLNVLNYKQDLEHASVILDSQGPQAGAGAHTDGISIPVDIGPNKYVHLGHQWVLDDDKMIKLPSGSDKYISGVWKLTKDLLMHSPFNNSIAKQHYMDTYIHNVVKQFPKAADSSKNL